MRRSALLTRRWPERVLERAFCSDRVSRTACRSADMGSIEMLVGRGRVRVERQSMPRYGPLGEAPNPLQRAFVRWRWAAPAFFGLGMSAFFVFLLAFPAARGEVTWLAVGIVGVVSFSIGSAIMFFAEGNHRSTRDQRADRWAWYMPWFRGGSRQQPEDADDTHRARTGREADPPAR